jgi:hypothetical protein
MVNRIQALRTDNGSVGKLVTRRVYPFDVPVVVHGGTQRVTTRHNNRGSGGRGTAPDDMGHDGTALQARDYETAALHMRYTENHIYCYPTPPCTTKSKFSGRYF